MALYDTYAFYGAHDVGMWGRYGGQAALGQHHVLLSDGTVISFAQTATSTLEANIYHTRLLAMVDGRRFHTTDWAQAGTATERVTNAKLMPSSVDNCFYFWTSKYNNSTGNPVSSTLYFMEWDGFDITTKWSVAADNGSIYFNWQFKVMTDPEATYDDVIIGIGGNNSTSACEIWGLTYASGFTSLQTPLQPTLATKRLWGIGIANGQPTASNPDVGDGTVDADFYVAAANGANLYTYKWTYGGAHSWTASSVHTASTANYTEVGMYHDDTLDEFHIIGVDTTSGNIEVEYATKANFLTSWTNSDSTVAQGANLYGYNYATPYWDPYRRKVGMHKKNGSSQPTYLEWDIAARSWGSETVITTAVYGDASCSYGGMNNGARVMLHGYHDNSAQLFCKVEDYAYDGAHWTLVGDSSNGNSSSGGAITLTWPSGVADGDLALILVSSYSQTNSNFANPSATGFTVDKKSQSGYAQKVQLASLSKVCTGSESGTFNVTFGDFETNASAYLVVYRPVNATAGAYEYFCENNDTTASTTTIDTSTLNGGAGASALSLLIGGTFSSGSSPGYKPHGNSANHGWRPQTKINGYLQGDLICMVHPKVPAAFATDILLYISSPASIQWQAAFTYTLSTGGGAPSAWGVWGT